MPLERSNHFTVVCIPYLGYTAIADGSDVFSVWTERDRVQKDVGVAQARDQFATFCVPDLASPLPTHARQASAARGDAQGADASSKDVRSGENVDRKDEATAVIPFLDGPIACAGEQRFAVRMKYQTDDRLGVAAERRNQLKPLSVPDLRRVAPECRNRCSIRIEISKYLR